MTGEDVLSQVIVAWVSENFPEQPGAAERAAAVARASFRDGATVGEACRDARSFVGSWVRHPSHGMGRNDGLVALAS